MKLEKERLLLVSTMDQPAGLVWRVRPSRLSVGKLEHRRWDLEIHGMPALANISSRNHHHASKTLSRLSANHSMWACIVKDDLYTGTNCDEPC